MQIVGYERATPTEPATLKLGADGSVSNHRLEAGTPLEYALEDRHCAGQIDGTTHHSCARDPAPYCESHTTQWPCATCRGQCAMPVEPCHEEHAIYLAAFEPATFKVGVTRRWRLETRLREQGARRGAHVRTVENGRVARQIEAEMANDVPDRVAVETKIDGLSHSLDETTWQAFLEPYTVMEEFEFDYDLALTHQPIPATVATGRVRGTRGRILVLDRGETTYAVDLKDLVGYEITAGGSNPDRQASLGAF